MKNLLRWEMKQNFKSKAFWGFGTIFVVSSFLLNLIEMLGMKNSSGLDMFLANCNNINSFFVLCYGIFAGLHIAGAFEERRIQASVMAGNSRLNIVIAKYLSFFISTAIFSVTSLGLSSVFAFMYASETGVESFRTLMLQCILYIFAQISFLSICFVISMFVKSLGASIGINMLGLFSIDIITQLIINKSWGIKVLRFTPLGQTTLSLMESSASKMMISVFVSSLWILISVIVAYIMFRKEELK